MGLDEITEYEEAFRINYSWLYTTQIRSSIKVSDSVVVYL